MNSTFYLILKALHIISIICWMAGLLYLFRLFVYHAQETESVVRSRFVIMEQRLYQFITVPAMIASFIFGFGLILLEPTLLKNPWLHSKLLFVAGLVGTTLYGNHVKDGLSTGELRLSSRRLRWLNELPTLLMIAIVFLVVLKPWARL